MGFTLEEVRKLSTEHSSKQIPSRASHVAMGR